MCVRVLIVRGLRGSWPTGSCTASTGAGGISCFSIVISYILLYYVPSGPSTLHYIIEFYRVVFFHAFACMHDELRMMTPWQHSFTCRVGSLQLSATLRKHGLNLLPWENCSFCFCCCNSSRLLGCDVRSFRHRTWMPWGGLETVR